MHCVFKKKGEGLIYRTYRLLAMGKQNSKLRPAALDELMRTTSFDSEEDIQLWFKGFIKDCPNGCLTADDFKRIYSSFFPNGDSALFSEYVFRTFDRNRDGIIDFQEFLEGVSVVTKGDLQTKLEWAFRLYDLDGNGFITKNEMLKVTQAIYKMVGSSIALSEESTPEKRTDKIFRQMDTSKKGRLSMELFFEGVKKDPSVVNLLLLHPSGITPSES